MKSTAIIQQIERLMTEVARNVEEPHAGTIHSYLMEMWELALELYKQEKK